MAVAMEAIINCPFWSAPQMARLYVNPLMRYLAERSPTIDRALRRVETGIVDWLWTLTANRPIEKAPAWGAWFGAFLGPKLRKNKHVLRNLEVIFPNEPPARIRTRAKATWAQIGRTLAEYPHMEELSDPGCGRFEVDIKTDLGKLKQAATGHILIGMHQANWNLHGMIGALTGLPVDLVYAEQKDPYFESRIAELPQPDRGGFYPCPRCAAQDDRKVEAGPQRWSVCRSSHR